MLRVAYHYGYTVEHTMGLAFVLLYALDDARVEQAKTTRGPI